MLDFDIRGLVEFERFLEATPDRANKAMSLALNSVVGGSGLVKLRKAVEREIDFPAGYVNDDRLYFAQHATPTRLEASVIGRQRATSLARFASGSPGQKGGVTVRVKNGSKFMKSAFLVRLKSGTALSDDHYNVGLAIRLQPGQALNKKDTSRMVHLESNVVLLYGPSIDQILRNEVAESESPKIADDIADEFFRQFGRLS